MVRSSPRGPPAHQVRTPPHSWWRDYTVAAHTQDRREVANEISPTGPLRNALARMPSHRVRTGRRAWARAPRRGKELAPAVESVNGARRPQRSGRVYRALRGRRDTARREDGLSIYGAGITLGSILAFAVLGEVIARTIGGSIRNRLSSPTSETLDGFGGAVLGFALSLMLVWAVGVFALLSPPLPKLPPGVRASRILQALYKRMPSGLLTRAVADLDPLPQIRGPEPEVSAPEGRIVGDPDVQAASASTLRVRGIACGYGVEGSGWVAGRNLVVTNAHVVAGETETHVQVGGTGRRLPAKVVVFDEKNDIAILRVNRLGLTPLHLAAPMPGKVAAVIGFPENGP